MADEYYRWPDWMPRPQQDGFKLEPVDTRTSSDMEIGSVIREEFHTDQLVASGKLLLDRVQAAWFEGFEQRLLHQGVRWFYFPLWVSGEIQYRLVRMQKRSCLGQTQGLDSLYAVTLEVENRELLDDELLELLLYYTPEEICWAAGRLHVILHVEAPGVTRIPADLPWAQRRSDESANA